MASLLSLSGGDDVSSSDFYLEYLCRSSFRLFHEPLHHRTAPPLSPSTPQTSRIANDHGALLSVDPQIMCGGLLSCTDGHQQKVTALDDFQTSRKLARDR